MKSKGNNQEIVRRLKSQMTFAGEQLEAVKDITFEERNESVDYVERLATKRLEDGAELYHNEVPITLQECFSVERDNLAETIEEVIDALISSIAETMLQTQLVDDKAYRYLKKANAYLYYALYFLIVASKHDKKGKENE